MDVTAVLEEAKQLGVALKVDGERLLYSPRHAAPPALVDTLRQHKAEVMAMLRGQERHHAPYPQKGAQAEAEEIARRVMEYGICLIWAETVQDFLAFVQDDFDRSKIPSGFVIYTDSELKELFGDGKQPSNATLRLIHEAKKQGGHVISEGGDSCQNRQ